MDHSPIGMPSAKWCRVDEKPAVKQFTALIFSSFCIKAKGQKLVREMS
jgi:hypothetical protein